MMKKIFSLAATALVATGVQAAEIGIAPNAIADIVVTQNDIPNVPVPTTLQELDLLEVTWRSHQEIHKEVFTKLIENTKKKDVFKEWLRKKSRPSLLKKSMPGAIAAIGTASYALLPKVLPKVLPTLLSTLPPNIARWVKHVPTVAGLAVSAYYGWKTYEFKDILDQISDYMGKMDAESVSYLEKLIAYEEVSMKATQINSLGRPVKTVLGAAPAPTPISVRPGDKSPDKNSDILDQLPPSSQMVDYYLHLNATEKILNAELLALSSRMSAEGKVLVTQGRLLNEFWNF